MKQASNHRKHILLAILPALFAGNIMAMENLPFIADDLNEGERWSSRTDILSSVKPYTYHFVVKRYSDSSKAPSWITLKRQGNPMKNMDYLAYGKPVYAMADGVITHCWRNAPENPRPRQTSDSMASKPWLHTEVKKGRIPSGGNQLWIESKDGTRYHYAHMTRGSIPRQLCPHNESFFDQPGVSETAVPEHMQIQVRKGQLLGMVGNSGNSSTTQLEILKQVNGKPSKPIFAQGLASIKSNKHQDMSHWSSFAGSTIPDGNILIWPARRPGAEFAQQQYTTSQFKRLFLHLTDSGYAPEWIDGYSVGGKIYYNSIWRPAKVPWRAYVGLTLQEYNKLIDDAKADGFSATQVESYRAGDDIQYATIFKKTNNHWRERHHLNADQHQAELFKALQDGFTPINISVVSTNNQRFYTVLYQESSIGNWLIEPRISSSDFRKMVDDNNQSGRKLFYINSYMHENKLYFAAIFAENPGGNWREIHDLSGSALYTARINSTGKGMLTRMVTGYDGAQHHRFAALWRQ